jgi:hypothetical protein
MSWMNVAKRDNYWGLRIKGIAKIEAKTTYREKNNNKKKIK